MPGRPFGVVSGQLVAIAGLYGGVFGLVGNRALAALTDNGFATARPAVDRCSPFQWSLIQFCGQSD